MPSHRSEQIRIRERRQFRIEILECRRLLTGDLEVVQDIIPYIYEYGVDAAYKHGTSELFYISANPLGGLPDL